KLLEHGCGGRRCYRRVPRAWIRGNLGPDSSRCDADRTAEPLRRLRRQVAALLFGGAALRAGTAIVSIRAAFPNQIRPLIRNWGRNAEFWICGVQHTAPTAPEPPSSPRGWGRFFGAIRDGRLRHALVADSGSLSSFLKR